MSSSGTLIIAEAGVNHNGSVSMARELVNAAASAGADAVKFQTFMTDALVLEKAEKAPYQKRVDNTGENQHEMLRKLELDRSGHLELIECCSEREIEFLSSAFDEESLKLLNELGITRFKIPSGELTNVPYLRLVSSFGKRIILSSGMATLAEVENTLEILEKAGTPRQQITVLHCNTAYPTPMEHVNLRAMLTVRDELGVEVGYSDHTLGCEIAVAAVAMGATVIEKHFTLDKRLPGPDHRASLEVKDFNKLVRAIRNVEAAFGDGIKQPSPSENENIVAARKSIVARTAIKQGEQFSRENLTVKRPATGVSPMEWDQLEGRIATRSYKVNEQIESS